MERRQFTRVLPSFGRHSPFANDYVVIDRLDKATAILAVTGRIAVAFCQSGSSSVRLSGISGGDEELAPRMDYHRLRLLSFVVNLHVGSFSRHGSNKWNL
jgi:hypothetical protein